MTNSEWLHSIIEKNLPQKFAGSMVEYYDGKLRLPHSTRYPIFIADESPWLHGPMDAISNPAIRRVDFRGPAGCAKSLVGELYIAWCLENEPGLLYYVHQSDPDGRDAMEDRVYPMIVANPKLNALLPADRHKDRKMKIAFPHMTLYCVGANLNAAQSKRVKVLIMEEPHLWRDGMVKAFEKRCKGVRDPKILTLSTGSIQDDETDKTFQDGSRDEWHVPCPFCETYQPLEDSRERLIFDRNDKTIDGNNNYNWDEILKTVRYNCAHCGQDWPNSAEFRREQANKGKYIPQNENAVSSHKSFHLNSLAVHYFSLGEILQEKLQAAYALKCGQEGPMKDYVQKQLGNAWSEAPPESQDAFDFERQKGAYFLGEAQEDEIDRYIGIDNQHGKASKNEGAHRWWVCRSFGQTESRLIGCGRVTTWEDMEQTRIQLGVKPDRTFVDVAYDATAVQEVICRYGWQGLWGDNKGRDTFPHHIKRGNTIETRHYPFSPQMLGQVGIGKGGPVRHARYYFWCQQSIKNTYHRLRSGLSVYRFTVAQDTPKEYKEHTSVEFKRQIVTKQGTKKWEWTSKKGADNHLLDCDQECLVAAMMSPVLRLVLRSGEADEMSTPDEKEES